MSDQQFVLITGLSGSGKSTAAKCFEDLGFFCVDNLPLPLLRELMTQPEEILEGQRRIAIVTDVRAPGFASELPKLLAEVEAIRGVRPTVVYFEASEEALLRRFSETRRPHPLAGEGALLEGIRKEREVLSEVRGAADLVYETSRWTIHDARAEIYREFAVRGQAESRPVVSVVSFGFKHGAPAGSDLVFDVRFLPNPHFVHDLQPLSGKDAAVRQFLESHAEYGELIGRIEAFLDFSLPRFRRENRSYVSIGVGCTGGRHRSVAVAEELGKRLGEASWAVRVLHRDIQRVET